MPKSTAAEVSIRVQEVESLLLVGKTRHEILKYGQKWGIVDNMVDQYIASARKNIQEINNATLEENRAQVIRCLWKCYHQAIAKGDIGEQRASLKVIGEFTGLAQLTVRHVADPLPNLDEMQVRAELENRNQSLTIN